MDSAPASPPMSGASIDNSKNRAFEIHRRRRKHEDASKNSNGQDSNSPSQKTKRKPIPIWTVFKSKLISGDRKKDCVGLVVVFLFLSVWISSWHFEYKSINEGNYNSIFGINDRNNYIRTKHTTNMGSGNSGRRASHAYDSIFCPAGSFKNTAVDHKISSRNQSRPVFLWGIPSTTSEFEVGRRKLLRETYLKFYEQIRSDENYLNITNGTLPDHLPNAICSFHEWTCNANIQTQCQLIYVFFIGGHESLNKTTITEMKGRKSNKLLPPPFILDESVTDFREMLLPLNSNRAKEFDLSEPGTIYLDIRENQFDGKMTTWFKFASLIAKEYNSETISQNNANIEYVFKVDSDLILFTPHFFRWFEGIHREQQVKQGIPSKKLDAKSSSSIQNRIGSEGNAIPLSSRARRISRVYGGIEFPATNCVEKFTFDHPCPLPLSGPSYMSGELNFVSVDLATYIASNDCPREIWTIPHEDVSLSNYVYSYTHNTGYHKREKSLGWNNGHNEIEDYSITIVGVNESRVLLLPNMKADWNSVNIRRNPDLLRTGELLWGHSIKRGNHTQYLYWKKDSKFLGFWILFIKAYTSTGSLTPNKVGDAAKKRMKWRQRRKSTNNTKTG